ncbi:MAG: histidine phosphatase family protein [Bacteroidetes bacterium]|nr:MAG: histidine phosphatase family protein [Bacteroidota bacterium]
MKSLVLCRHAKSDWPLGVEDINRPLKPRGVRDANSLGDLLRAQHFSPDLIVASPALRARSTADLIARKLLFKGDIQIQNSVYDSGAEELLEFVRALPGRVETAMIFGHNPTMEQAVQLLLKSSASFYMPTCAMVCIETVATSWEQLESHNLHLRWMLIPRLKRVDE